VPNNYESELRSSQIKRARQMQSSHPEFRSIATDCLTRAVRADMRGVRGLTVE
jgi:hypothetical protein